MYIVVNAVLELQDLLDVQNIYPQVNWLPALLLIQAPDDHVRKLNYQNQGALSAKILIIKFWHMVNRSTE